MREKIYEIQEWILIIFALLFFIKGAFAEGLLIILLSETVNIKGKLYRIENKNK